MILVDTGPLVALADSDDRDHARCVAAIGATTEPLVVPIMVVVETMYLVARNLGVGAEAAYLRAIERGEFGVEPVESADWSRIAELVETYADLRLGTADASVVTAAERLGVSTIATLDHRHFAVVRPQHVEAFTLIP